MRAVGKIRATLIELFKRQTPYREQDKVFWNGEQNNYPEEIERVVLNSPTGARAFQMFTKFIFGNGISEAENKELRGGNLLSEVAKNVVDDVALQNGAFIHVAYGIDTETGDFIPVLPKSLNYEMCRISNSDDDDNAGMILHKHFNKFDVNVPRKQKNREKWYYPFSKKQSVIKAQINKDAKEAGYEGEDWTEKLQYYRGQVMYLNLTPKFRYAISKFDSVFNDLDTENRISIYTNSMTRKGFMGKTAILTKGLDTEQAEDVKEQIAEWLGSENASTVFHLDVEQAENLSDVLHIEQVQSQFNDKQFEFSDKRLRRNILGAANNLPQELAFSDNGSMFDSGEKYTQLKEFYWEQCEWERQKIEEAFWKMGFSFNFLKFDQNGNSTE
jgi:hypothetical protein